MSESVDTIAHDPRWLPHRLSPAADALTFVRLERDDHRSVTFLEDQYFAGRFPPRTVAVAELLRVMPGTAPIAGLDFVFHSSMALSTLAARLFDVPGVAMGLKEPVILNGLAARARAGRGDPRLLGLILRLLARPFGPGERVVVKLGNVANRIIPDLMATAPAARALILHAPLDDFLRSIAKKGLPGRIAYRRLFRLLRADHGVDGGFSPEELFDQTDLQITALAWLNHHAQFARVLPMLGGRARSVSSRTFLARRAEAVAALVRLFDLPLDPAVLAVSPAFDQHSKELGRPYDAARRAADYAAVDVAHGEEIGMVAQWGEAVARHCAIPMTLPHALLP